MCHFKVKLVKKDLGFQGCHISANIANFEFNGNPCQKSNIIFYISLVKDPEN